MGEDEAPPTRIGDYLIEGELGAGGMAKVYRARHAVLDTLHAIKVLDPGYRANTDARNRFLHEAKIQAKHLDHPSIVKVSNIVATPEHAALVMELVDGPNLESLIGKLVRDPAEVKRIMIAVLDAVGYAHKAGIIHRDLKPANVLLAKVAGQLVPKVTDFGIAKVTTDAAGARGKHSTRGDARMGTLQYMSPEQVRGAKHVTPRSDIFSLGVMLYELATGSLPFAAENDFDLMSNIVNGRHEPPEKRNPAIDPALAEVIKRALSADPEARYATCAEMATAMGAAETASEAKPAKAEGATRPERREPQPEVARPVRAKRRLLLGLGAGAVVCAGVVGVVVVTRSGTPTQRPDTLEGNRQGCDAGDAARCTKLGRAYLAGDGVGKDVDKAGALFDKACVGGALDGCANLGTIYQHGLGVEEDGAKAFALYEKACTGGDREGCDWLGLAYLHGVGVAKDATRAVPYLTQACDAGLMLGCHNLATLYQRGTGVSLDDARALALYQRACDGGEPKACTNLGFFYERGIGTAADAAKAVAMYQRACDGGSMYGCSNLALAYMLGRGVAKDQAKAVALYQKACDGDLGGACTDLGAVYNEGHGVRRDPAKAATLFQKGCDREDPTGCAKLGEAYEDALGVGEDKVKAIALFQQACAADAALGCARLGNLHAVGRVAGEDAASAGAKAAALYQTECDDGDRSSCVGLARLYLYNNTGIPTDEPRSIPILKKACDAGEMRGCTELGNAYQYGWGVARDEAAALTLYKQACDGGELQSCASYAINGPPATSASYYLKACDGGFVTACTILAELYENGTGVAKDAAKAAALYTKGCDSGTEPIACRRLAKLQGTAAPE